MSLRETTDELFHTIMEQADRPELDALMTEFVALQERLSQPLRLAVIGLIKAGKSTLMNALMEDKLVITGTVETTYRVNWFMYGPQSQALIHLRSGEVRPIPLSELPRWTVRAHRQDNPKMDEVRYITIQHPNSLLQNIELIDTPGLASSFQGDSANTMEFLGLAEQEDSEEVATAITAVEASSADAYLCAFSRGITTHEGNVLKILQGYLPEGASPINAVGVLTKVDHLWTGDVDDDPFEGAKRIVARYSMGAGVNRLLYTILPVNGVLAENALSVDARDVLLLLRLREEQERQPYLVKRMLNNARRFCGETVQDVDFALTPAERRRLWEKLGGHGLHLALIALSQGILPSELPAYLYDASGIRQLRDLIWNHFGNRAFLIKLRYVLSRIRTVCSQKALQLHKEDTALRQRLEIILEHCDLLEQNEHAFAELKVLQAYYEGAFSMSPDETKELLEITGENGANAEARLGVDGVLSLQELAVIAKNKATKWRKKANRLGVVSRKYQEAAQVLCRSCEIMYQHLSALVGYARTGDEV